MKTVGLIGGTSWHSTADYYRHINTLVNERTGTNPPLILYSQNIELMRRGDWDEINATYLSTCQMLVKAGAEAIVICANTPHMVYPFVQPQIDVPILHIADATAIEADQQGLRKLGLLGTLPVVQGNFISGRLSDPHGIDVVLPNRSDRTQVHRLIADELTLGQMTHAGKELVLRSMNDMKDRGAEGMIMGCTELPMLISQEDFELPLLDTTALHAQMVVDFILS